MAKSNSKPPDTTDKLNGMSREAGERHVREKFGRRPDPTPPPPSSEGTGSTAPPSHNATPTGAGAGASPGAAGPNAPTGRPLPSLVTGTWIADNLPTIPDELVHNLLHRGCKMVLGGGSKSFKTWCLADLAISISTGSPWWGIDTVQGAVVYLNFELQAGFFHDRLQRIAEAKNVDLNDDLLVWNLRGFSRPSHEILPEVAKRLEGRTLSAIVIDPVYKLAAGLDENAAKDMGSLLNDFERLAEDTGAAVIFGAHFSKGNQAGKESMDRISGSGVYARDPDAILTMTRHSEEGAFTIDATLRNCPSLPPFAVRWDFPLMQHAPDLDPAQLKLVKTPSSKRTYAMDDIVNVMPMGEALRAGQWQKLAKEECGVGSSRFYELKKEIESTGHAKVSAKEGTFTRIL